MHSMFKMLKQKIHKEKNQYDEKLISELKSNNQESSFKDTNKKTMSKTKN
jgi:hypothetical protein